MKLNLGSCNRHEDGFLSVDLREADFVWNLNTMPWPWDDGSVEHIKAWDLCEHLNSRIDFMNECWRVLQNGGRLHITTPNAAKGGGFFQDPTHCTPYTINTFKYFCVRADGSDSLERARFYRHYGISARFKPIYIRETNYQDSVLGPDCARPDPVYKIEAMLEAIKSV